MYRLEASQISDIDTSDLQERLRRHYNSKDAQIAYKVCKCNHLNIMASVRSVALLIIKNPMQTVNVET